MIPRPIKKNVAVEQQLEIMDKFQQSHIVKNRLSRKRKEERKPYTGVCKCCKREGVKIVKRKDEICYHCYNWCKNWIKSKYGYYNEKHIPEAMVEFRKPIKCKFFHICGNYLDRVDKDGRVKKGRQKICPTCYEIYLAGINLGNAEKRRSKFVGRHKRKRLKNES